MADEPKAPTRDELVAAYNKQQDDLVTAQRAKARDAWQRRVNDISIRNTREAAGLAPLTMEMFDASIAAVPKSQYSNQDNLTPAQQAKLIAGLKKHGVSDEQIAAATKGGATAAPPVRSEDDVRKGIAAAAAKKVADEAAAKEKADAAAAKEKAATDAKAKSEAAAKRVEAARAELAAAELAVKEPAP